MVKNLYCLISFLFFCILLQNKIIFAQKIEIDKKTKQIKVDKIVFGKIEVLTESSIDQLGVLGDNTVFSIKDVTGKEIILAKTTSKLTGLGDYAGSTEYLFRDSGKTAYTDAYSAKSLAKEIVNFGILTKEGFNEEGEKKLLLLYSKKPKAKSEEKLSDNTTQITINHGNNNTPMLERDRNADIFVLDDEISQDFVELGTITDEDGEVNVFKVYNHNKIQIAEATMKNFGDVVKVVTFKDNQIYNFKKKSNLDTDIKQQIATYLTNRYYW